MTHIITWKKFENNPREEVHFQQNCTDTIDGEGKGRGEAEGGEVGRGGKKSNSIGSVVSSRLFILSKNKIALKLI